MSRLLLHFFHRDHSVEELARWERSAQLLEKNLFLLEGRHPDPSSIERARQALQQAKSHLRRPAA